MSAAPTDPRLYQQVKNEAKARFAVWPSAYASGWLVREYKKRGGRFQEGNHASRTSSSSRPLERWYEEKWVNVCVPSRPPCGRSKSTGNAKGDSSYPYCRPSVRVSPQTPITVDQLTPAQIAKRCARKRASPKSRVTTK